MNLADKPTRIDKDVVEACIKYYHNKGDLNSRSTMECHLESIKSFYDYLSDVDKARDIFTDYSYSKFKDDIVEKYSLLEPVERGSYSCEDIKSILINLDKAIDQFTEESSGIREEDRHLQRIILRLFIKITLVAPAKRSVITDIKRADIKEEFKKLYINGIYINIPCGLSRDLRSALKYAESKNKTPIKEEDNIAGLTLSMIEATYYSKDWNVKYEEDMDKCINKSIAQNDYYCYV